MKINIGNNNEIKNSTIGYKNNNVEENPKKDNNVTKIIMDVIVAIIGGLIVAFLIYKLGWN